MLVVSHFRFLARRRIPMGSWAPPYSTEPSYPKMQRENRLSGAHRGLHGIPSGQPLQQTPFREMPDAQESRLMKVKTLRFGVRSEACTLKNNAHALRK